MDEVCEGCGIKARGGTAGCQAMFDELGARPLGLPPSYAVHRRTVDTYCLQHPASYCVSAKSLAAHLTGLCCAFEHRSHPTLLRSLQQWLNGTPALAKPELPVARGEVTIADVVSAPDAESEARALERWARSTWEAYSALHPLARRWIQEALAGRRR